MAKVMWHHCLMTVATVFRDARKRNGLTQERLAYLSEVSLSTIQRLESGNPPTSATLFRIAKIAGVDPDQLAEAFNTAPA